MKQPLGPVVFCTIYTLGVALTVVLAMVHDRLGEAFLKIFLPAFQIVITTGAILSAWFLQQHKRTTDERDLAKATADAVLAVASSIDKTVEHVAVRSQTKTYSALLFSANALILREEVTSLSTVPLTALRPAAAAVALVDYRRVARQASVIVERCVTEVPPKTPTKRVAKRLTDLRTAERELIEALGRALPERLRSAEYVRAPGVAAD
ncbi:hypothetical protein [Brevundimonas sp. SPF441]|uniref:hypothetical protein n=1 Tax=Brevundimonas sp. SPF441 TaxID=2663795 RepID=UPI00129ED093|nr:hypothetical protein [Brevundimonas sp. SPF441]MRL69796.1 hypothetical protein [Brevundimonas sp. SPF441]